VCLVRLCVSFDFPGSVNFPFEFPSIYRDEGVLSSDLPLSLSALFVPGVPGCEIY
jgi:hypothetical protein